jgi:hypothetical protein
MKYAEDMQLQDENFDAVVTRAIERRPEVSVPVNFAARVAAALPSQRPRRNPMQVGRIAAFVAAGVLAVAMCLLAPHATPTFGSLAFDFELVVIVQLGGIAYWLTARRGV